MSDIKRNAPGESKYLGLATQHIFGEHDDLDSNHLIRNVCPTCLHNAGVHEDVGPDLDHCPQCQNEAGIVGGEETAENLKSEADEDLLDTSDNIAHSNWTANDIERIKSRPIQCDYIPGGAAARIGQISSCGKDATHFVYTKVPSVAGTVTERIQDPTAWKGAVKGRTPSTGYFTCEDHEADARNDIDDDEHRLMALENPGEDHDTIASMVLTHGDSLPIDTAKLLIPTTTHKKSAWKKALDQNRLTYAGAAIKKMGSRLPRFSRNTPIEGESPIRWFERYGSDIAEQDALGNRIRTTRSRRRKAQGVEEVPIEPSGRPLNPKNEKGELQYPDNKVSVKTYDASIALERAENVLRHVGDSLGSDPDATAEEKIERARQHIASGLKFSGQDLSNTMVQNTGINEEGTRTPGADERLFPENMTTIREGEAFRAYGVPPVQDVRGLVSTPHMFNLSVGADRISDIDKNLQDAPKYVNSDGELVDYITGESTHPGFTIEDSDRGTVSRNTEAENPFKLTIKHHPKAGPITLWNNNVHHVHQIPYTEHLFKMLKKHGLEGIAKLPPEALGRQHVDSEGNPRYFYVPSTKPVNFQLPEKAEAEKLFTDEADDSRLKAAIMKEYAKRGTLRHKQDFESRMQERGDQDEEAAKLMEISESGRYDRALRRMAGVKIDDFLAGLDG